MSNYFDEAKVRRAGDGKFAVKGFSEAGGGTETDLGGMTYVESTAPAARGIRAEGRMQVVGHVQGGLATKYLGDAAELVTENGTYRGHTERHRGAFMLVDENTGAEHVFYDADNCNNLTPPTVQALNYLERDTDPLPADRDEQAVACLGPYASNAEKREFERSMRRAGDDEAGAQIVFDANRFTHEQRDLVAAAELLEARAEARLALIDEDSGPDSMPDPDTDAMMLKAEGFRDFLEEKNTYDAPSPERAAAVAQARAALLARKPEAFNAVANAQTAQIADILRNQGVTSATVSNYGHALDAVDLPWGALSQNGAEDSDHAGDVGTWGIALAEDDYQEIHYSHLDITADPAEVAEWAKGFRNG